MWQVSMIDKIATQATKIHCYPNVVHLQSSLDWTGLDECWVRLDKGFNLAGDSLVARVEAIY